jgi:hypothetical protein
MLSTSVPVVVLNVAIWAITAATIVTIPTPVPLMGLWVFIFPCAVTIVGLNTQKKG